MKLLVLVAALVLAVSAEKEWTSFKVKYQKSYTNVAEEKLRFSIFQENLKKIEEHNVKYQKGEVSYYLGVNKFADWTSEEFRNMLNLQKANKPKIQGTYAEFKGVQLPESIDWREKGAVLEVKDQGSCGSCWAFSTTGALEAYNVLVNNVSISLSEQDLVDCSRLYENDGCGGGLMTYAFEFVKHHGLTTEESYPYVGVDGTCARDSSKIAVRIDDYKLISHGEEGLKEAVGTIGPISVSIYADEDLSLYAGGVYDDTTCQNNPAMLNHGVLTVGYGSGPGTEGIIEDYWIIKNSWGADWGEDGYFRMIRNPTICGITLDASYPIVTPL